MKMYVQYGCGLCAPAGWRNFDSSATIAIQRLPLVGRLFRGGRFPIFPDNVEKGDIVKGLPIANRSADVIYCCHVLEHLALNELRIALQNTHSYLKPGGVFRFVLPDLEAAARRYLQSDADDAAIRFMQQTLLGTPEKRRGIGAFLRAYYGRSKHLWMWDFKALRCELLHAGFTAVRRVSRGDSGIDELCSIEDEERWQDSVGVQCEKPPARAEVRTPHLTTHLRKARHEPV